MILQILWRTCKKDVLDQIDIPPLREEIHWLQFR
jgi:E3 ubiquitin-protein ligase SHPRH